MEKDIIRHEGENLGGINRIRILPVEGIQTMPHISSGVAYHEVAVKTGYRWLDFYCTEFTMSYKEDQQESDQGPSFKRVIAGKTPKHRGELVDQFSQNKARRYIADVIYNNGFRLLVGSPEEPLTFSTKHDSKADPSGRNEHDVTFTGDAIDKSPEYCVG